MRANNLLWISLFSLWNRPQSSSASHFICWARIFVIRSLPFSIWRFVIELLTIRWTLWWGCWMVSPHGSSLRTNLIFMNNLLLNGRDSFQFNMKTQMNWNMGERTAKMKVYALHYRDSNHEKRLIKYLYKTFNLFCISKRSRILCLCSPPHSEKKHCKREQTMRSHCDDIKEKNRTSNRELWMIKVLSYLSSYYL